METESLRGEVEGERMVRSLAGNEREGVWREGSRVVLAAVVYRFFLFETILLDGESFFFFFLG